MKFYEQMRTNSLITHDFLCSKSDAERLAWHLVSCGFSFACSQVPAGAIMFHFTPESIEEARRFFMNENLGYELQDGDRLAT